MEIMAWIVVVASWVALVGFWLHLWYESRYESRLSKIRLEVWREADRRQIAFLHELLPEMVPVTSESWDDVADSARNWLRSRQAPEEMN